LESLKVKTRISRFLIPAISRSPEKNRDAGDAFQHDGHESARRGLFYPSTTQTNQRDGATWTIFLRVFLKKNAEKRANFLRMGKLNR